MMQRPETDRHLDASLALATVREQLPALECRNAELLGSGWGTDVYLLDDRYTARFPRNAREAESTDFDVAVFGVVSSSLSRHFAVPSVIARGKPGAHFPYDFLVCTFVRGVTAGSDSAPHSDELAGDLGRALTHIHSMDVDAARNAGVRPLEWDASYEGSLHFIHADFRDGNIIVHPDSGRLAGVVDWGNAALGDPAVDFMTLVLWRGWEFMHRALDAYALPVDDAFVRRVEGHVRHQSELNRSKEL